jgi:hypothetical protein
MPGAPAPAASVSVSVAPACYRPGRDHALVAIAPPRNRPAQPPSRALYFSASSSAMSASRAVTVK